MQFFIFSLFLQGFVTTCYTFIRASENLTSAKIGELWKGSPIRIVEIRGRRARINFPSKGWISVQTQDGRRIIEHSDKKVKNKTSTSNHFFCIIISSFFFFFTFFFITFLIFMNVS